MRARTKGDGFMSVKALERDRMCKIQYQCEKSCLTCSRLD